MTSDEVNRPRSARSGKCAALSLLLGSVLLVALLLASPASAAPAAADQYAPSPTQQIIAPGGNEPGGPGGGPGSGPVFNEPGEAGGGELPFTGYPLTPLILIVLALLTAGLVARGLSASAERRRQRRAVSS